MSTKRPDPAAERDAYQLALEHIARGKRGKNGVIVRHAAMDAQHIARTVLVANGVVQWTPSMTEREEK